MILVLLTICLYSCNDNSEYFIAELPYNLQINDTYQLYIFEQGEEQKILNNKFKWSSGNEKIVEVSGSGEIKIVGYGRCVIKATSKWNKKEYAEYVINVPYQFYEESFPSIYDNGTEVDNLDEILYILKSVLNIDYKIVKYGITEKVSLLGTLITVADFFNPGKYMYTRVTYNRSVENGVLCALSNWTNDNVFNVTSKLNTDEIHAAIKETLHVDNLKGVSFEAALAQLKNEFSRINGSTNNFYFSNYDEYYQYRIVLVADYDHCVTTNFYMRGLLAGFGVTLSEIFSLTFNELEDNYLYDYKYDDISGIKNIEFRIERRINPKYLE